MIAKSENKQNQHLAIVYFLFCQRHSMLHLASGLFDMDPLPREIDEIIHKLRELSVLTNGTHCCSVAWSPRVYQLSKCNSEGVFVIE